MLIAETGQMIRARGLGKCGREDKESESVDLPLRMEQSAVSDCDKQLASPGPAGRLSETGLMLFMKPRCSCGW
jgi:hypothetical protein